MASFSARALATGKAMTRLHGSFSYERRPRWKPVAAAIFPLSRAPIPRENQNCSRSRSAAALWPRAAYGGPMALITESHRKRGIAPRWSAQDEEFR